MTKGLKLRYQPAVLLCASLIARFMGPTWNPPGTCRPQVGPMWVSWTLYFVWWGKYYHFAGHCRWISIQITWCGWACCCMQVLWCWVLHHIRWGNRNAGVSNHSRYCIEPVMFLLCSEHRVSQRIDQNVWFLGIKARKVPRIIISVREKLKKKLWPLRITVKSLI